MLAVKVVLNVILYTRSTFCKDLTINKENNSFQEATPVMQSDLLGCGNICLKVCSTE